MSARDQVFAYGLNGEAMEASVPRGAIVMGVGQVVDGELVTSVDWQRRTYRTDVGTVKPVPGYAIRAGSIRWSRVIRAGAK